MSGPPERSITNTRKGATKAHPKRLRLRRRGLRGSALACDGQFALKAINKTLTPDKIEVVQYDRFKDTVGEHVLKNATQIQLHAMYYNLCTKLR